MEAKNQYPSINFLGGFIEGISIVNFLWAISTLLFLVVEKASWVLVDSWITSETFHDVQSANRRCTGHATMSTERGSYRLITVFSISILLVWKKRKYNDNPAQPADSKANRGGLRF